MRPYVPGESFYNLLKQTIPNFVDAEYPTFIEFVTAYLRFLEQKRQFATKEIFPTYGVLGVATQQETTQLGGPFYEIRKLLEYRDADTTLDEFKVHFLEMFGKSFPNFQYVPTGTFVQALRQFYQNKGTSESVKFFFRTIFNEESAVYFPRKDILRASDGTWDAPIVLKVSAPIFGRPNQDVATFYAGQRVQTATGSAQVEVVTSSIVGQAYNQNIVVNELKLKFGSVLGTFVPGQQLVNIDSDIMVTTIILPVVSDLTVEDGGSNYAIGDIVQFSEGPAGGFGYQAFGQVSIVSNTAINGVTVLNGGNGFTIGDDIIFTSISGQGAKAAVANVVYGDFLLENGTGFMTTEQQTAGVTNYLTLEDQSMLFLELIIDPFCNAVANVIIDSPDYGSESGVPQMDGVVIDSQLEIALAATDEKPFMIPWVFTNDLETAATLANASATLSYSSNTFFANTATLFVIASILDVTTNVGTSNVTANVIISQVNSSDLTGKLYLKEFTGFNKFSAGQVLKANGAGTLQTGTVSTDGSANVTGNGTHFTALRANTHIRFNGQDTVVKQVVNNTFLTTFGAAGVSASANVFSVIPTAQIASITLQQQKNYGKIKAIQLLNNGAGYKTPPAVTVDSVDGRAQELFHLDPDPVQPVDPTSANNTIVASGSAIHVFDAAVLKVRQSAGQVQKVKILNSGVNYQDANATIATAIHGDGRSGDTAQFQVVTGALTFKPGEFTTTASFLSSNKFLQDSTYYNDYTYVVRVAESFDRYRDILEQLIHPAGFNVVGEVVDVQEADYVINGLQFSSEGSVRPLLPTTLLIRDPGWGNGVFAPQTIYQLEVEYDH